MKKSILIIALTGLLILAGCSEKTLTVDYYMENAEARVKKIKECANNPGELEGTPNCENAMAAQVRIDFSSKEIRMPTIRSNRN